MDNTTPWNELYGKENEPRDEQIKEFVGTPLWEQLANSLQQAYAVKPKLSYSNCAMDKGLWKGWNVKYKKSGKALCTLYPKRGYFLALVMIGAKELAEADMLAPLCGEYMRGLYNSSQAGSFGKSLAIEVTDEDILRDMLSFIALRVPSRKA